jgi:hypothetical protein
VPRYSRWFGGPGLVRLDRTLLTFYRVIGERRATAVSLAMQLYRADHGGRWPTRIEELTPKYISAVPTDPFCADGRLMGYEVVKGVLPGGGDRPVIFYEAGGAGVSSVLPREPTYSYYNVGGGSARQYRDLWRWQPAPAATQPGENSN